MPNPKLLLFAGVGWSATNPLYITLKKHKIINSGVCKEPGALQWLSHKNPNIWKNLRGPKYDLLLSEVPEHKLKNSHLIFSKNATLNDYVEYYKWLSGERNRRYVADFSNHNAELSPEFISEIAPVLNDNFDVRVIFIVRDPVRRGYSQTSSNYRIKYQVNADIGVDWNNNDPQSRFKWRMLKKHFPDSISYWKNLLKQDGWNTAKFSYTSIYHKYAAHFPTLPLVMEDLWGGNTEPLENFLECKINSLHRNCYYPEMGTKAPRYEELPDQWMSDLQDLSKEDYAFGKKHTQWIYDEWYEQFKTRPWE